MHSFQFTVSNKGRKGPVLTLWLKWNENPVKAHHSNRCTNKNNVVLISWSFNFSAIANGSNFGLCKVLTSWNDEKLGKKTISFTVKSLTQRALICILAEIHHLTISQISPTHSLSLLFPLGWVSLGQNSGEKKNFKNWGSCEGCIEWKEWRESCDWNQIFPHDPGIYGLNPWANLLSFHYATLKDSLKRQRLKTWCKDYQGLSKNHRLHILTATLTWEGWQKTQLNIWWKE